MKTTLPAFLLAALAGSTMALQGALNSALGKIIGLLEATLVVLVIGTVTVLLLLYPFNLGQGSLGKIPGAPWYTFLGGVLIVFITFGVVASMPRIGVANATTAIVAAQVATAVVVDHFGLFGLAPVPFSYWKILGLALMAAGTRLMLLQ